MASLIPVPPETIPSDRAVAAMIAHGHSALEAYVVITPSATPAVGLVAGEKSKLFVPPAAHYGSVALKYWNVSEAIGPSVGTVQPLPPRKKYELIYFFVPMAYAAYIIYSNFHAWTGWLFRAVAAPARAQDAVLAADKTSLTSAVYLLPVLLLFIATLISGTLFLAWKSSDEKVRASCMEIMKLITGYVFGAFTGVKIE